MTLDELVAINKDYFIQMNTAAIKAVVFTYLPFMKVPPLSTVLDLIVKKLVTKVADRLDNGIYFQTTDLRMNAQGKAYVKAKQLGYQIELSGTPEEKERAKENIKAAFRLVGRLTS